MQAFLTGSRLGEGSHMKKQDLLLSQVASVYDEPVTRWLALLREIERGSDFVPIQYYPLRQAIIREIRNTGTGKEILRKMLPKLRNFTNYETLVLKNKKAFASFIDIYAPTIESIVTDFTHKKHLAPTMLGKVAVRGGFHAKIRMNDGSIQYHFWLASDWSPEQILVFVEMLTIRAEQIYSEHRNTVRLIDLTNERIYKAKSTFINERKKILAAVEILDRARKSA